MVEHGKCASGSSKGRAGAYAMVLDAIGFLQSAHCFQCGLSKRAGLLLVSNRRTFNSGRAPFGIQIPRAVTSTPTVWRRLPERSHPPPNLRRIPFTDVYCALWVLSTTCFGSYFHFIIEHLTCQIILLFRTMMQWLS